MGEKSKKKRKILNQLDKVKKSLLYMTSKLNKTLKTEQEMVNELNIQIRYILKNEIYNCKKDLGRNNNLIKELNLIKEILCAETELIKINKIETNLRENIQKIEEKIDDKERKELKNLIDKLNHRINEIRVNIVRLNVETQNIVKKKTNI